MSNNIFVKSTILCALIALPVAAVQSCRSQTSTSSQISDASITTAVKAKMIGDSDVKAGDIDVNTEEGVVYLMGRVATQAEKAEAERLARSCDGVRKVVNHIEVGQAS